MDTSLNIYQRISAAQAELRNLEKKISVGEGKSAYKAVSDQQVTLAVKEAEQNNGIVSFPIKEELVSSEVVEYTNSYGQVRQNFVSVIKMTCRFINLDKPEDYVETESYGRGVDTQDKDFGKASTYARKYAMLNMYKIATGEDPDKDKSQERSTLEDKLIQADGELRCCTCRNDVLLVYNRWKKQLEGQPMFDNTVKDMCAKFPKEVQ